MAIFTSMAQCYSDYRPRYPQRLLDDLRRRTVGERGEHLVDWGCGTGELALRLSPFFDRVTAVDASHEMLKVARENGRIQGSDNVRWIAGRAEDVPLEPGGCDLIVVGSAFHRMNRHTLAGLARTGLRNGGALAIVGGAGGHKRIHDCSQEWHAAATEFMRSHRPRRRRPAAKPSPRSKEDHREILRSAGFAIEVHEYPTEFSWRPEETIGYLYTIAFFPPVLLQENGIGLEDELAAALSQANPSGVFREEIRFYMTIAYASER